MALFIPKDRKSLFRQFLAGMYDAVVITDPSGHIIELNPRAVKYFGYEEEDVLDSPISVIVPGLKREVVSRIRRGLVAENHVIVDANGVSKAGKKIPCEIYVTLIDLMSPGDMIFTIRNMERRNEYMNSLWARANAFRISQTALFACDAQGRLRECNPSFLQMFGLKDVAEAREHVFSDFMNDDPLPENFRKALQGETTTTGIVAEGDEANREELEIVLAPDTHGRKTHGVVGSIQKVG